MSIDSKNEKPPVRIGAVADALGVSVSWVRRLADTGEIPSLRTTGGHRVFDLPAVLDEWERRTVELPPVAESGRVLYHAELPLKGLEEHVVWRDVAARSGLAQDSPAYGVLHYVLTEMLNNAIDHSDGSLAVVTVRIGGGALVTTVDDDGMGIFDRLRAHLDLPDVAASILELSKGKRTTDPEHHTGEGVFFSSRAAAVFSLESNGVIWVVDNRRGDQAVGASEVRSGTTVTFSISLASPLHIESVFSRFVDEERRFNRTRPSVKLAEIGTTFVSRSEARRLVLGLEKFEEVELDFAGVTRVGQGFADEVFRVWAASHPGTRLVAVRMIGPVEFMVRHAGDFGKR